MIDLLPLPQDVFACPCGKAELKNEGFYLPGMVPMVRARCPKCGRSFLAHLHIGFCGHEDFIVDTDTGEVHSTIGAAWYRDILLDAMASRGGVPHPVERLTRRALGADVLLLNCLDPIYGHCLHRLFNFDFYREREATRSVVAIVPRFMAWLVPQEIDEVWVVDAPLRFCNRANETIATMTATLAQKARRLGYAAMIFGHELDIARYAGVEPFTVTGHESVSPARLTLNWREDRCWSVHGKPVEPAQEVVQQQHRLYCLLLEKLREQVPDLDVVVTGYGRSGHFPPWVQDWRLIAHDSEMERRWAQRYARSHLSFGMHGSNMILPAALSCGAIELVETRFWPHILVTWEWANRMSALDAMMRYRQLPASSSISDIVSIALFQLRRMQGAAIFDLMRVLRGQEPENSIFFRHRDALLPPDSVTCRDERGQPF